MGLETVNDDGTARLHQLNTANPTGTDNKNQGDDHIRNIKKVIKDQFSGISGDTDSGAVTATASNLNALTGIDNIYDVVYPVGCIYESTDSTDPSTLFTGTTWTAFGQGKMLVGLDPNDDDFDSTDDSGGSKTVTLTEAQMPTHDHDDTFSIENAGNHTHSDTFAIENAGNHRHSYTKETTHGGSVAGAKDGLSTFSTGYTDYAGVHNHSITGGISNAGTHNHSINGSVSNAGSGEAHDNMPPYIVVYRWKRDS